jgi:hypothetical protein
MCHLFEHNFFGRPPKCNLPENESAAVCETLHFKVLNVPRYFWNFNLNFKEIVKRNKKMLQKTAQEKFLKKFLK